MAAKTERPVRTEPAEGGRRVSRRDFLKTGAVALGTAAAAGSACGGEAGAGGKSLIHIYLPGGPSHLDTFDLKPHAPADVRGEFRPVRTNVAGVEICELLPRLARLADRFTIVRSVTGLEDEHSPRPSDSGWPADSLPELGGRPGIAAVLAALRGPLRPTPWGAIPTSVDLTGWTSAGYLGERAVVFEPADWQPSDRQPPGLVRRGLANSDGPHVGPRERERLSDGAALALDVSREPAGTLGRYGIATRPENARLLQARRLIEAGVGCVSLAWGDWDTHGNNFGQLRRQLPALDLGLSALIEDLAATGRLEETLILMSGEFGRTPHINDGAGRDHWPAASCALLAGGGLRHGRVVGRTDRLGRFPHDPVPMPAVLAAAYAALGVDAASVRLTDGRGGRHPLLRHTGVSPALA